VIVTASPSVRGHTKRPRSRRFASRHIPWTPRFEQPARGCGFERRGRMGPEPPPVGAPRRRQASSGLSRSQARLSGPYGAVCPSQRSIVALCEEAQKWAGSWRYWHTGNNLGVSPVRLAPRKAPEIRSPGLDAVRLARSNPVLATRCAPQSNQTFDRSSGAPPSFSSMM